MSSLRPKTNYIFIGEGMGLPGLPHRITPEMRAASPEYELLLTEAVAAGQYVSEGTKAGAAAAAAAETPAEPEGDD